MGVTTEGSTRADVEADALAAAVALSGSPAATATSLKVRGLVTTAVGLASTAESTSGDEAYHCWDLARSCAIDAWSTLQAASHRGVDVDAAVPTMWALAGVYVDTRNAVR